MTADEREPASSAFADRYLLARYDDGGVVIDLESGNYFRVNGTAALVCEALVNAPDRGTATSAVARKLNVDGQEAGRVIEQVAAGLAAPSFGGEIQGSYHFFPTKSGYELRHGPHRVLEVDADGSHARIAPEAPPVAASQLELYVRAVAPKLLFQRGISVLHASACVVGGQLTAFAGVSGAGKTTTARAFAASGASLVSEDLLVLAPGETASVLTDGENRIHAWTSRVTSQLLADRNQPVPTSALAHESVQGPISRLHSLSFLDRARRRGTEFHGERLGRADALAELLRHDFLGAFQPASWRHFFNAAVALLEAIDVDVMWTPAGLGALTAAATRYISKMAS